MSIFKLLAVALISVVLTVVVKTYRPEMAVQTSIAAGATVLLMLVGQITGVLNMITDAVRRYGLNEEYFTVALKTAGIADVYGCSRKCPCSEGRTGRTDNDTCACRAGGVQNT